MTAHISLIHEEKEPFRCKFCDKNVIQKFQFDNHIALVHELNEPFKCKFCDKNFTRKDNLNVHISAIHERKMPFECKFQKILKESFFDCTHFFDT